MGRSILITTTLLQGPKLLLRISLYNELGIIALTTGLETRPALLSASCR